MRREESTAALSVQSSPDMRKAVGAAQIEVPVQPVYGVHLTFFWDCPVAQAAGPRLLPSHPPAMAHRGPCAGPH